MVCWLDRGCAVSWRQPWRPSSSRDFGRIKGDRPRAAQGREPADLLYPNLRRLIRMGGNDHGSGEFTMRFRPRKRARPRSLPCSASGAIDFLGKSTGCRKRSAIIKTTVLVTRITAKRHRARSDGSGVATFASVEAMGHTYHPYSRRDEHFEVFVCRDLNAPLSALWPKMKKWD